ncbi:hypothetical protein RB653_004768 [Dictyostelium firmibasis]|uniref:Uncharacterized protein n=1 Tax=Dictyostelium firmibasis TaxID=79012 RepID=A0AAN7Z0E7_9MYCE
MTVLLEQEYKSEIDTKVFKVLVAFSQSIERSLINNQNTLHQAENTLNINIDTQPQAIDSSQFDSSNLGLYTVQLVRNVIKRSNDLSNEFNSVINIITQQQQQKDKQYKDEIQFLKSRIEQLSNTNTNNIYTNDNNEKNNNNNNIIKSDKLDNISLEDNSKENNNEEKQNVQKQSSPVGSSLSVSNKDISLDWDTKYQTEMQLNAMLSEFLKDDFEISNLNLGVSDEVSSTTSPSISTTSSTANTGLGSSGSFSPNLNTTSPSLNLSNSSANSLSTTTNNNNNNSNNSNNNNNSNNINSNINNSSNNNSSSNNNDKTQQNVQKKAMLTDLLDQIDLDSVSNTPSKQKKGKFKFF